MKKLLKLLSRRNKNYYPSTKDLEEIAYKITLSQIAQNAFSELKRFDRINGDYVFFKYN